ncbi:MAG: DNA polymerase III subunit delta', partial [Methyloligellaceae bacterium]
MTGTEGEGPPEADRLNGFLHPRETYDLFGQSSAESVLLNAFTSGRLHHAWLLSGTEGIGKATLAYRFARFLLASPEERDGQVDSGLGASTGSPAARQIARQAHPNLLVVCRPWTFQTKRFAATIPVDEVRRLRGFLGLTAAGGNWRIVIIDSADELNRNAANALLKALEEPPGKCVFFLISAMAGRLLPTIRSRCQRLELNALEHEDLREAVVSACRSADREPPAN